MDKRVTNEKTAPVPVVGETGEQPLCNKHNEIIADLNAISMTELYEKVYPPKLPVVDGFLNCGTYLFVGAPKVGKSFFMAQLAYHVSMGIPLWDYPVRQGSVLYLALEDEDVYKRQL